MRIHGKTEREMKREGGKEREREGGKEGGGKERVR